MGTGGAPNACDASVCSCGLIAAGGSGKEEQAFAWPCKCRRRGATDLWHWMECLRPTLQVGAWAGELHDRSISVAHCHFNQCRGGLLGEEQRLAWQLSTSRCLCALTRCAWDEAILGSFTDQQSVGMPHRHLLRRAGGGGSRPTTAQHRQADVQARSERHDATEVRRRAGDGPGRAVEPCLLAPGGVAAPLML